MAETGFGVSAARAAASGRSSRCVISTPPGDPAEQRLAEIHREVTALLGVTEPGRACDQGPYGAEPATQFWSAARVGLPRLACGQAGVLVAACPRPGRDQDRGALRPGRVAAGRAHGVGDPRPSPSLRTRRTLRTRWRWPSATPARARTAHGAGRMIASLRDRRRGWRLPGIVVSTSAASATSSAIASPAGGQRWCGECPDHAPACGARTHCSCSVFADAAERTPSSSFGRLRRSAPRQPADRLGLRTDQVRRAVASAARSSRRSRASVRRPPSGS